MNLKGFGSVAPRFPPKGFHPRRRVESILTDYPHVGPGAHSVDQKSKRPHGVSYSRQLETEHFSRTRGYRVPYYTKEQGIMTKDAVGPGRYNIKDFLQASEGLCGCVSHRNKFSTASRLPMETRFSTPPPGHYSKEPPRRPQGTRVPLFEWDGFVERSLFQIPSWSLPPNRYQLRNVGSVRENVSRVVSKRGPYDLFTGPRDGSTIRNHFAPRSFQTPPSWAYDIPADTERLQRPGKHYHGRWRRAPRFSTTAERVDLSPASYNPRQPVCQPRKASSKVAFGSSERRARPTSKRPFVPGTGRYDPATIPCKRAPRLRGHQ